MLTYRTDGSGEPLVLLNGGLMTINSWDGFIALLGDRFRLIRCDFRGQLLSPGPFPTTWEEHARDVVDVLDASGVSRAHVLGTSFGGEVALLLAAIAPERVSTVTAMNCTEKTTDEMRAHARQLREVAQSAADGADGGDVLRAMAPGTYSETWLRRQAPDLIERRAQFVATLPRPFFAGAAAILELVENLDLSAALGSITAPTLVIAADNDATFPVEHSRAIANAIPGARLEVIADSGHAMIIEQAQRAAEVFLDFVAEDGEAPMSRRHQRQ
jgi:3-oxoadipate enol-lactonase